MKNYNLRDVKYSFNFKDKRVISSKTKFLDDYIYKCRNLTAWLRYRDSVFRWEEVLFFLEIPNKNVQVDLEYFSKEVEKKYNGSFYALLKKIEVYFNQEDLEKQRERMEELSCWRRGKLLK